MSAVEVLKISNGYIVRIQYPDYDPSKCIIIEDDDIENKSEKIGEAVINLYKGIKK